jgi:hypothetical protein
MHAVPTLSEECWTTKRHSRLFFKGSFDRISCRSWQLCGMLTTIHSRDSSAEPFLYSGWLDGCPARPSCSFAVKSNGCPASWNALPQSCCHPHTVAGLTVAPLAPEADILTMMITTATITRAPPTPTPTPIPILAPWLRPGVSNQYKQYRGYQG